MRLFDRWCRHRWEPLKLMGVRTSNFQYVFHSRCLKCGKQRDIEEYLLDRNKTKLLREQWNEDHKDTFSDYCYMCKERRSRWEQTTDLAHLTLHQTLEIRTKPVGGRSWSVEEAWTAAGCG